MQTAAALQVDDEISLDRPIAKALAWLDREQHPDGYWVGKFECHPTMEAEWLMAMHVLGYEHPRKADIAATLLAGQSPDGAWKVYPGAHGDINSTVECYAALRSTGMAADAEPLVRARHWIEANGGLPAIRAFSRYWLALIGEWPWDQTPSLPPEIIAAPKWFPFNIYNFAAWARATIVPLSILSARRVARPLPEGLRLDELFPEGRDRMDYRLPRKQSLMSFGRLFFFVADRMAGWSQRLGFTPGRRVAIKACLEWIVRHQEADGHWGGYQPPWIYSLLALDAEGYPRDHPVMAKGLAALDGHWSYDQNGAMHIQACDSPVWDTWLTLQAMADCGREYTPAMERALDWLLEHEVTYRGDWAQQSPQLAPGGWSFQRANLHYPDLDDTAIALCVLARLPHRLRDRPRVRAAIERGLAWALGMQSRNGGWGAYDRDNDKLILTKIPFADFGEVLDPPAADLTAHMVEALGLLGYSRDDPAVERAYRFLRDEQEPDGPWFGRWGVNYIYGTGAVLPALAAIGEDMNASHVRRAAEWVVDRQNADGGWGESCASYMDDALRGRGTSTASQTGWSLMALLATRNRDYDAAVRRGLAWLARTQRGDGSWDEPQFTGTGFPGYVFGARPAPGERRSERPTHQGAELQRGLMIRYGMYRHYFPLMAMARARSHSPRLTTR